MFLQRCKPEETDKKKFDAEDENHLKKVALDDQDFCDQKLDETQWMRKSGV